MEEKYHDLIDRYVRNEMAQEERFAFEQQILNDEELRHEVDLTRRIKSSLSDRQKKLRITSELMHKKRNKTIRIISILSIAASVAIGIFLWYDTDNNIGNEASTLTAMVKDENKISVDSKEKAVEKVQQAIRKCNDKAVVEAVDEMERDRLIPGINNVKEIRIMSNRASEVNDSITIDAYELYWIKINSLINIGDTVSAKKILVDYLEIEGRHKTEAERLLKKMTDDYLQSK